MSNPDPGRYRPTPWIAASMALHLAGLATLALSPGRWPLVLGGLWANHVSLLAAGLWPRSRVLGPNICSLADLDCEPGQGPGDLMAFTFDDGPDPELTPRVLDLLDQHGAKASFFCIGKNAEKHPDLVREIAARGHLVENHTWSHSVRFIMTPTKGLRRELSRTQTVLTELAGRRPCYFRAPAGFRSPWLEPLLVKEGLQLVTWTARGFDGKESDPTKVLARLEPAIAHEGILLLHDGLPPGDRKQPLDSRHQLPVLAVLPQVLATMRQRNIAAIALPNTNKTRKSLTSQPTIL